jgi:hypothetical protein
MFRFALLYTALFTPILASAKVWHVGPTQVYQMPSAVAPLVSNTDTVLIDVGTYAGDVTVWTAHQLYITSIGIGYAHIPANGNHAQGKAIWVIKGNDCMIEGIEFSGCQVPDKNGAGIRQEGINLTLRNCSFHHNEMGILTNNDGISTDVFISCEFGYNGYGDGQSHNIYVGHIGSLTLRNCYSHNAKVGHLVKSRAEQNYLYYNRLTGEQGDGSYEVDLPNGGKAILLGNLIEQSEQSQNGGIIAFGLEGATNQEQQLALSHNTIWNRRFNARFVHTSAQNYTLKMANNLLIGPGTVFTGATVYLDTTKTLTFLDTSDVGLIDLATYQFGLRANSPCHNAGAFQGQQLQADYQYVHPLYEEPRLLNGPFPDIGAYEFIPPSGASNLSALAPKLHIFPNPVTHTLHLSTPQPLGEVLIQILSIDGSQTRSSKQHVQDRLELDIRDLPNGAYRIKVIGQSGISYGHLLFVKE